MLSMMLLTMIVIAMMATEMTEMAQRWWWWSRINKTGNLKRETFSKCNEYRYDIICTGLKNEATNAQHTKITMEGDRPRSPTLPPYVRNNLCTSRQSSWCGSSQMIAALVVSRAIDGFRSRQPIWHRRKRIWNLPLSSAKWEEWITSRICTDRNYFANRMILKAMLRIKRVKFRDDVY